MKRIKFNTIAFVVTILVSLLVGCNSSEEEDTPTTTTPPSTDAESCFESGDILVSNGGNDAVLAFSSAGDYKGIVYQVNTTAGEAIFGMDYLEATDELAVVVDGTDRVMAISAEDCSARILIADANLTGTLRGVTQLSTGDILVVETSNIERFSPSGVRITTGGWPRALQTTGTNVNSLSAGGFVHCSTGTDVVRLYDDAGTQTATVSSGIAATTDAAGCVALTNGNIAAAWSGTTDSVIIYNSNLSTPLATYSNTAVLSTPGGVAARANGNILIADRVLHYLVEITSSGVFVGTIGDGLLNTPEYVLVVP